MIRNVCRAAARELAEAGLIDGVIVRSISRFSREEALLHVADVGELLRYNVLVHYAVDTDLDPSSESYPILLTLKAGQAYAEKQNLKRDTIRGLSSTKAAGTWLGGVPWGWRRQGYRRNRAEKDYTDVGIEPDLGGTWEQLEECYRLRDQGRSLRELAVLYNRDRESIRSSLKWSGNRGPIDRDLFDRVQSMWSTRRTRLGARPYPFAGIVMCPFCGRRDKEPRRMAGRMTHDPDGTMRPGYTCARAQFPHAHRNISERRIFREVRDAFTEAAIPISARSAVIAALTATHSSSLLDQRQLALAELDRRERRVKDGFEAGLYDVQEARRRIETIEGERDALPPEPVPVVQIRESLKLLASLPALLDRISDALGDERPTARAVVARFNELARRTFRIELDPVAWKPVVVWRSPYDRIVAAATEAPPLEVLEGGAG